VIARTSSLRLPAAKEDARAAHRAAKLNARTGSRAGAGRGARSCCAYGTAHRQRQRRSRLGDAFRCVPHVKCSPCRMKSRSRLTCVALSKPGRTATDGASDPGARRAATRISPIYKRALATTLRILPSFKAAGPNSLTPPLQGCDHGIGIRRGPNYVELDKTQNCGRGIRRSPRSAKAVRRGHTRAGEQLIRRRSRSIAERRS